MSSTSIFLSKKHYFLFHNLYHSESRMITGFWMQKWLNSFLYPRCEQKVIWTILGNLKNIISIDILR